jgi:predicted porin
MNKKLLSLAIAAAMVAPAVAMADTTIYGRINTQLVNGTSGDDSEWDVEDNASRFGVKGSEDLGNGMKAIFQYEWAVDSENTGDIGDTLDTHASKNADLSGAPGRLAYVGLTGGFGTVAIGRQWTPYYGSVDKTDIMQTNSMNDHYIGTARIGNALAYVSPNFGGFSAKLALVISDESTKNVGNDTGEDGVDIYNLSLDYNNGPLSVGFSYISFEGTSDTDQWGLAAKYNFGNFALIGQYEDADNGDDAWGLGAEAYFGNNTVRGVIGEKDGSSDYDNWAIGFEHAFSKRTRVFVEYEDSESNASEEERFSVGIRHDF